LARTTPHSNLGAHHNAKLTALEDAAIRDAIRLQEESGLASITDGEFRRRSWWTDFAVGLDGIDQSGRDSRIKFRDAKGRSHRPCIRASSSRSMRRLLPSPTSMCSLLVTR
jgi:methionine synthase II (cobalamin-independent)